MVSGRLSTRTKDLKGANNTFITQSSKSVYMWATDSPKAESLFLLPGLSLSNPHHKHVLMCVLMCVCVHRQAGQGSLELLEHERNSNQRSYLGKIRSFEVVPHTY